MQRTNRIKAELAKDNLVCGCMVAEVRTPTVAMVLEGAGLDFFIIDMEHGSFTFETANDILVACRGLNITPFVRVPGIDREVFQKTLDAGAMGLLVPRVESAKQVEQARDYMRYAPVGSRGLSLRRAHSGYSRPDPVELTAWANSNVMLMVQIETKKAVEDVYAVCSVPGIDVLFVGPSDLAQSYGYGDAAHVEKAVERVVQAGKTKGIATGIHHSNAEYVTRLVGQGMRFISLNTEVGAMIGAFSEAASTLRSAAGASRQ